MNHVKQIKVAVVDDHVLFRKGLVNLIREIDGKLYHLLFEADNGKDCISKLDRKALPDILLMDISMPEMDGFETVSWLQNHYPEINIVIISMYDMESYIVRMLKLGVKGYLTKRIEPEDLSAALRSVSKKGYYYTEFITGKLIHSLKSNEGQQRDGHTGAARSDIDGLLTERERDFIKLACSEMTYDQIALQMNLSPKTIDNYREAVFKKMNVKNRVGLVLFAVKNHLFEL